METEPFVLAGGARCHGPLPESDGFKYILLIGDQFSKWYEAILMQNQEAKTVAKSFVDC